MIILSSSASIAGKRIGLSGSLRVPKLPQRVCERCRIDGLRNHADHPNAEFIPRDPTVWRCRHENRGRCRCVRQLSQGPKGCRAIHFGHMDIKKKQLWVELLRHNHGSGTGLACLDGKAPDALESKGTEHPEIFVVLDIEDTAQRLIPTRLGAPFHMLALNARTSLSRPNLPLSSEILGTITKCSRRSDQGRLDLAEEWVQINAIPMTDL
jgi:hypothetical protein